MRPTSDCIGRLGSRLHLILDPANRSTLLPTYGRFDQTRLDLAIGIESEAGRRALPLTSRIDPFGQLEQHTSMTSVTLTGIDVPNCVSVTARFTSPFYPRDEKLSTAPFFYLDIELRKTPALRWRKSDDPQFDRGTLFLDLAADDIAFTPSADRIDLDFATKRHTQLRPEHEKEAGIELEPMTVRQSIHVIEGDARIDGSRIAVDYDLSSADPDDEPVVIRLLWTAWETNAPLQAHGEWTRFKYTRLFDSAEDVKNYALSKRSGIEEKCRFLDGLIDDWSLGVAASRFTSLAFHSFLLNTWWTVTETGRNWFSVWEGSCYYHSTIDVEYNDAFVYLALWPELLKWPSFVEPGSNVLGDDGADTLYFCHDVGSGAVADAQHYHHPMPVEENCNYLLLMLAYVTHTGDTKPARKHFKTIEKAVDFIVACDTSGNGFVNEGVANTIDDASPAVQYGREQTYLAVKCLAAVEAFHVLSDALGKPSGNHADWTSRLRRTLEREAWLGDRYAVTLTRTTDGLVNAWSGEPLPPGELEGWDAFSIYTTSGCVYPMIAGLTLRLKRTRLAADVDAATRETMTPIGSRHSSAGRPVVWISQNLWRDIAAAYLGLDMLNNIERYWDYEVQQGGSDIPSVFYDTSLTNNLCCYPRGTASLGWVYAASGLVLNRLNGTTEIHPLRDTLDVPLLPLVDWKARRAPWLRVRREGRRRVVTVENEELLEG